MPYKFKCRVCYHSIYVNRVPDINTKYNCDNCNAHNWIESSHKGLEVIDIETFQTKSVKEIECPNCNKPQNINAIFCKDCGTEISPKELVTIAYCDKCESEYDESYQFCEEDGNQLVLKKKEIDESPKNIIDAPKDSNEIDKDKVTDLPMNWYQAFTYAMLPLFIICCAMTLNSWGGVFTEFLIVTTAFLIIGLHSMSKWAPPFFNFYIFTSFLPIIIEYNNFRMDVGVEVET